MRAAISARFVVLKLLHCTSLKSRERLGSSGFESDSRNVRAHASSKSLPRSVSSATCGSAAAAAAKAAAKARSLRFVMLRLGDR
jgi:hypothetical protein